MAAVPKAFIEGIKSAILPDIHDLKERIISVENRISGLETKYNAGF